MVERKRRDQTVNARMSVYGVFVMVDDERGVVIDDLVEVSSD